MGWLQSFFGEKQGENETLSDLRERFSLFHSLLDRNNQVLRVIGDMEEKAQGEYLFDLAYIRRCIEELRRSMSELLDLMVALGGDAYQTLRARYTAIDTQIASLLPGGRPLQSGPFILGFDRLNRIHSPSVGSKNAQLGEMHSIGLNVPRGFAITAWAYHHFLEVNDLQERINLALTALNIREHDDLITASKTIRKLILESPLPLELSEEIQRAYESMIAGCCPRGHVAMRSSAIGEDTLYSFAGQYSSFLNVPGGQVLESYRDILASKFTPRAIYYFLSHSLEEVELAMSVGCMEMIDAAASGVIYSRDPLDPEGEAVLIHSIYGLGPYLVEGKITPDVFRVRRDPFEVLESRISRKSRRLRPAEEGGTCDEPVPADERDQPSVDEETLRELATIAVRLEDHYGRPQDIEWAREAGTGRIVVLQSRTLRMICSQPTFQTPDLSQRACLVSGGTTVCPGAGGGPVAHVSTSRDLQSVPRGSVVVAANPFPGLVEVMDRASALVTEIGSSACHMAALAREKRVPAVSGVKSARRLLDVGRVVTVDATQGSVYDGLLDDLIQARLPEYDLFEDTAIFDLLYRILEKISPLNLVNPLDADFRPERCETFHDITRYAHQRGIEEVFRLAHQVGAKQGTIGVRLRTQVPLPVHVLDLEGEPGEPVREWMDEEQIPSEPLSSFWHGVLQEGWPANHPDPGRFVAVSASHGGSHNLTQFTENSYAVIGHEYMLLSLRLGYHFTNVEAMTTDDPGRNFIRMHYKGGGAAVDRRRRRIGLLEMLLSRMGFEHTIKSDFIDSSMNNPDRETCLATLQRLGRLSLMTKQLDMALSNDRVARWYTEDIARRLGLEFEKAFPL